MVLSLKASNSLQLIELHFVWVFYRAFIKTVDELFALLYQVLTTDIKHVHSSSISTSTSYKSVSQKSTATVYPSTVTRTTGTEYSVGTSSRTPPSLKPPSQTSRSSPSSSRWLHTLHYDQYQTSHSNRAYFREEVFRLKAMITQKLSPSISWNLSKFMEAS